ncbi:16S rRNA (Guanine(966)-N(2))-methyltransferase RsmD [Candidatus Hydrogenisulfobacillus filiaventi]|uniref:16S rRNA (Guanine(966)-N(2))-methyltransferase RsmD n=1 Tax=Candidatus Hydrogenisulfobacillus filiaventi TaxID=2707344 RepID=A0A6F8ZGK8_9FIRM|nr:16S rRNA (Guanine(966)-N(2))-methyltransferase RsmD [Candidatus Hydrogenisulfobacillus filiaventi]
MRIIGGRAGGRRLAAPPGRGTRPTQERVREALFNILAPRLPGARVADLYAGTGALGLEAWSRGAASVWLVEPDRRARQVLRRNLAALGPDQPPATVWEGTAESALRRWLAAGERFDLVLADPPWQLGLSAAVRGELHRVLAPGGLVVLERPAGGDFGQLAGLELERVRRYGGTELVFYVPARGERGQEG